MSRVLTPLAQAMHHMIYHVYSIWLFTLSDLKTIVVPQTAFGIIGALATSPEREWLPRLAQVLARLPLVACVVWMNLLPFAIDNQRRPAAIIEDKHTKPWRPMPSGRMSGDQAKNLMFGFYILAFCISSVLGGIRQCLMLMLLGFCYNDLELADWSWVTRNAINGLGFGCFASAALEVAMGEPLSFDNHVALFRWLGMIGGIVFTTVQTQDMADQEGDKLRARKSMPLSIGDVPTRWITAVSMVSWSVVCPLYWGVGNSPLIAVVGLGLIIACRTLAFRSVQSDKLTFRLWNAWMVCLYVLPLLVREEFTTFRGQRWAVL
ncbi:UbiA prenyltransferase family-domain-containing protein [Hypoxylon cercidicola]|nr:UbiA prenyltransferase family-domain-containing protein [Hypoxylon cercidicola]